MCKYITITFNFTQQKTIFINIIKIKIFNIFYFLQLKNPALPIRRDIWSVKELRGLLGIVDKD